METKSIRIELTLTKELYEQIQLAQSLISHALPSRDLRDYLQYCTKKIIKQRTSVREFKDVKKNAEAKEIKNLGTMARATSLKERKAEAKNISSKVPGVVNTQPSSTAKLAVTTSRFTKEPFSSRQRKVLSKKQDCCQYVDPLTKIQCQNKWFLQMDHKQSRWAGGETKLTNAQFLCAGHNSFKYRREVGIREISS